MAGYSGGVYTRVHRWVDDRLANLDITDTRMDEEDDSHRRRSVALYSERRHADNHGRHSHEREEDHGSWRPPTLAGDALNRWARRIARYVSDRRARHERRVDHHVVSPTRRLRWERQAPPILHFL